MILSQLIEDLERLQFKLQLESMLRPHDESLSKRLAEMALETCDALEKAKLLSSEPAVADFLR